MNKVSPQILSMMSLEAIAREPVEFFEGLDRDTAEVLRSKFDELNITGTAAAKMRKLDDRNDELEDENRNLEDEKDSLESSLSKAKTIFRELLQNGVTLQREVDADKIFDDLIAGKTQISDLQKNP